MMKLSVHFGWLVHYLDKKYSGLHLQLHNDHIEMMAASTVNHQADIERIGGNH